MLNNLSQINNTASLREEAQMNRLSARS